MSFLEATWWRPATALVVLALAVLALSLSGSGTAHAGQDGSVVITPAQKNISVGGQGDVSIDITAPDAGTSIWIVLVEYDPTVVQVKTNPGDLDHPIACEGMASPGQGIAQAALCDVKDNTGNPDPDTAVALGGWVQNDNSAAKGFTGTQTAATFTFVAAPGAVDGAHTDLEVTVSSMLSPTGVVQSPATTNGRIDIVAAQGLTVAWGNGDCSPALTSAPGPVDALKILFADAGTPPSQTVTGCPAYGANVTVNGLTVAWGNFDCTPGGAPGPLDALKLLFVDAGTPPAQTVSNCPAYSSQVAVTT